MKRKEPAFTVKKYFPIDLVKPHVRKKVEMIVKSISTGTEAQALVLKKKWKGKWQAKTLDHNGRLVVLCYRGTEVALFYKRETVEYRTEVMDPTPYAPVVDPSTAWVRMEFLHMKPSAKRDTYFQKLKKEVNTKVVHLRASNKHLQMEIDRLNSSLEAEMNKSNRLKNRLERVLNPPRKKRKR